MSALTSVQSMSPQKGSLWDHSSNLSSAPLLSPSELAGDSERKRSKNDPIQALLLAQMRQNLRQQEQQLQQQLQLQMELDSYTQPKKRARLLMDSSDSSSKGSEYENPYLSGGMSSSSPTQAELGRNSLLGGLRPSLLTNSLSGNNGVGGNGSGNNDMTQSQQLLRKQQLEELQQLRDLKQREDMLRLSQLRYSVSSVKSMLQFQQQQHQQQQQHALSFENTNGNSWLVVQLKALKDQQDQHQTNSIHSKASSIDEAAVTNYMRKKNNNNGFGSSIANMGSQQNINVIPQMQHQHNDELPHPPPMFSAVSSLDSVAMMPMLLPQNQQHPQQKPQQPSSNAVASRLLGTNFSLGGANGGLGNNSSLNSSLLAPTPFPPPSFGSLGMGSSAASLFGSPGELSESNDLSSRMGWAGGTNLICPSTSGPVDNGLVLPPKASEVVYEQLRQVITAERESSVGKPSDAFVDRDPDDGRAHDLPALLAMPVDPKRLSSHQSLLRYQIEVFCAGEEDTCAYTRGRNKPIRLGQIGIRCRHCKFLPVSRRKRGSVYFPGAIEGFYQAAQNMNSTHLQTGDCPLMGNALRQEFANMIATRGVSTGAGRAYWAAQAGNLGLRNTEKGIVFEGYKKDVVCVQVPANKSRSPLDISKKH